MTDTNATEDFARQASVDEEFSWLDDNKPEANKPETKNSEHSKPELYSEVVKHAPHASGQYDGDKTKHVGETTDVKHVVQSTDVTAHGENACGISETSTEF